MQDIACVTVKLTGGYVVLKGPRYRRSSFW